ncbi:hypothetical protein G4Y79_20315 [Phototrophicus methaneseepsis]|uniref:DUF4282 domain-containing protein n=1 Tax=Phototrophicus methaneseepsis TaxID=2710758 RepID=A0A7S8E7Y6_9CHLR|nr:hypothetical protein [Phototrophicus methaneseepsis]QPC82009.1 hypothetical protein G4Y79_20315 [Phototrophicus methaneseepsis]
MKEKNSPKKKFPALRFIMQLYKGIAILIGGLYAIVVVYSLFQDGIFMAFIAAISGFFAFVGIFAFGEFIEVFLSIESTNRTMVELQKRILQLEINAINKNETF